MPTGRVIFVLPTVLNLDSMKTDLSHRWRQADQQNRFQPLIAPDCKEEDVVLPNAGNLGNYVEFVRITHIVMLMTRGERRCAAFINEQSVVFALPAETPRFIRRM